MCVDSSALSNRRIFFSWGEATSSGDRDAVSGSGDSFCMELSAACTSAGSSSHTSSQVATSFAPCLISVFGPHEFLLVTLPGTAYTSRFCSRAQREVIRVPLYSAASTTSTPPDILLMIRLRMGKFAGAGKAPTRDPEIKAPPGGFEFCQAGTEDAFGSAIMFDQFPDARRAQSRGQREREPVGALARSGVGGGNDHIRHIGHTA